MLEDGKCYETKENVEWGRKGGVCVCVGFNIKYGVQSEPH